MVDGITILVNMSHGCIPPNVTFLIGKMMMYPIDVKSYPLVN